MKCGTTILTGIICGLAVAGQARPVNDDISAPQSSDANGDHYGSIWLRNVFDLKPVPEVVKPVEKPVDPSPPPNVKLTGITTIFGKKMALFLVQPQPERGKPPAKEVSYMIHEGERYGDLEVLEIMPKDRKVTIKVDDVVSTITFPTNAPSSGGPPGARPPGQFAPPPGIAAPNFTPPGVPGGFPRPMRQPGGAITPQAGNYSPSSYSPSGYSSGTQGGVLQGGYVAPAGSTGGGSALSSAFTAPAPTLNASQATPVLTAEQQQAAIAITHQALMQAGTPESIGMASILPPVPGVTDGANNGSSSQNQNSMPTPPAPTSFGRRINGQTVNQ